MPSLNPSTDITSFINTIFEASILVARDNNVMTGLVHTFNDRQGVATRQNSQYGGMTVNPISETDDLIGQSFTPSSIATLTPSEAGGQYFLTDLRVESDPFNVRNDASQDMGEAMATKMETDLLSAIPSFTGGTIGTSGSTITWGHVFAMEAVLRAQKAPYPYFMIMHPYQWQPLAKAASVASSSATNAAPSLLEEVNSMFFVKQVGGVFMFVSANVPLSGTDSKPGMWSRDAIGLDVRRQPRIEPERDASRRGWELNLSCVYAAGVWRPLFGVQGIFACSAPTS